MYGSQSAGACARVTRIHESSMYGSQPAGACARVTRIHESSMYGSQSAGACARVTRIQESSMYGSQSTGGFVQERSRAVCRRGVPPGAVSAAFSLADLEAALAAEGPDVVYLERDGAGRLRAAAGVAGVAGVASVASVAARARLAPHVPARSVALQLAGGAGGEGDDLRLAATAALAPHDELLLWPDDALLARALVPCLAPANILAGAEYACHRCGARFEQPNPLKVHLYLACAPPRPAAFLRALLRALAACTAPSPAPSTSHSTSPLALLAGPAGHACLFCGKLYSRKYGLKIHIRTHTGYKPLRCAHCSRRFGDPSNLNKHVRLHAASGGGGGARHECAHCGAAHVRRRDLQRHVRAAHAHAHAAHAHAHATHAAAACEPG